MKRKTELKEKENHQNESSQNNNIRFFTACLKLTLHVQIVQI